MFHVFEESWTAIFRRRNENEKGMLKGQRRKLLFTVIFIMILTVSLNMIAFIWFQLRVYHMTFQQEFVYVKEIQELSVRFLLQS